MPGTLTSYRATLRNSASPTSLLCSVPAALRPLQSVARYWQLALFLISAMLFAFPAMATELEKPTGEILLTVSGNIDRQNHPDGVVFDLQMLEAMPVTSFETNTPWTKGLTKFTGVRLNHFLKVAGAKSQTMKMIAEDGYIYELNTEIDDKYPVIIAYKKNDEYMSLRQLGPLWVMFPFDDFPELVTEQYRAASVWQLKQLELK